MTYSLDAKYAFDQPSAFLTGTQALVRLPLVQRFRDAQLGFNTAGFISGYRGSPLGGYDQALFAVSTRLADQQIHFQPGVNEELAATAVWGSQYTHLFPGGRHDGVFGIWYGKGPGVDRSGDAFKHANMAGTAPLGGVLAIAGDDHAAKSSTTAHQSEQALVAAFMPILYPADVQDILDFGLIGLALSRYAGLWVAMKGVTDVLESARTVDLSVDRVRIANPPQSDEMRAQISIRRGDQAFVDQERRLIEARLPAATQFIASNPVDRLFWAGPLRRIGIISAGKAWSDLREALKTLGVDENTAQSAGISLLKIGAIWPLDRAGIRSFAHGLETLIVIEEKRSFIEQQVREILFGHENTPRIIGKHDEQERPVFPAFGELSPAAIAERLFPRLAHLLPEGVRAYGEARLAELAGFDSNRAVAVTRKPYFCSGCPHNSSTVVPDGSRALAGIGCHWMALSMDRGADTFSQMGGEGGHWVGQAPFTDEAHVFINMGDGTYFHSGLLAIRQAVAAKVNATYKILFNDAVAMTGGQPHDGVLTVCNIAEQLVAEGLVAVVVVADDRDKYDPALTWPSGVRIHDRSELAAVQRDLKAIRGVTALIYDQVCATELRRRRKRGLAPKARDIIEINEDVCEGCGDCVRHSNCVAVEPIETPLGRKRKIEPSACNTDRTCLEGFCPSFITISADGSGGGKRNAPPSPPQTPDRPGSETLLPAKILINGIGGTGVITLGQVVATAATIDGIAASSLDVSGLAQKGGVAASHIIVARSANEITAARIDHGSADVVLGCDLVATAASESLARIAPDRSCIIYNSDVTPTAMSTQDPAFSFDEVELLNAVKARAGTGDLHGFAARRLSTRLFGDTIAANMLLLGYAWQLGKIPVSETAIERALELNGVAITQNLAAFRWGRAFAADPSLAASLEAADTQPAKDHESFAAIVADRAERLCAYQDKALALRYRGIVRRVAKCEQAISRDTELARTVARALYKLMAYKDEYEVARLHCDPRKLEDIRSRHGAGVSLSFHLAPPLFARRGPDGERIKRAFPGWLILPLFRLLASMKRLRGTSFDIFGYQAERRRERAAIEDYLSLVDRLLNGLRPETVKLAAEIAGLPLDVKGFGPIKEAAQERANLRRQQLLAQWEAGLETIPPTETGELQPEASLT